MDDRIRRVLIWSLIIFLFFFGCIFSLLISPVMLILPVLITGIILLLIKLVAPDLWRVMVPHKPKKAPQTDTTKKNLSKQIWFLKRQMEQGNPSESASRFSVSGEAMTMTTD